MYTEEEKQFIRFMGKAQTAAIDMGGTIHNEQGEIYVRGLYEKYRNEKQVEARKWLSSEMSNDFMSVDERPIWVESESGWPFENGKPMIFIKQYIVPDARIADEYLASGDVLYIFGSRRYVDGGFEMIYKVVSQSRHLGKAY